MLLGMAQTHLHNGQEAVYLLKLSGNLPQTEETKAIAPLIVAATMQTRYLGVTKTAKETLIKLEPKPQMN